MKKVIIGIAGGIAAYKTPLLVRMFMKKSIETQVVMSNNASRFVSPMVLQTLSQNPVYTDFIEGTEWNNHTKLMDEADAFVVAPATANTISKFANGACENMLQALFLEADCPVFVAPAMEERMWFHSTTQNNIQRLKELNVHVIGPEKGFLLSNQHATGRMAEPEDIYHTVCETVSVDQSWKGKTVLVTAGPTYEKIDPVRYIGNLSSGKMGFEIARNFAKKGAHVVLVAGPTAETIVGYKNIERIDVQSAGQMYRACVENQARCDGFVMAAAVADYAVRAYSDKKIKKSNDMNLELVKNVDIIAALAATKKPKQWIIGFALETEKKEQSLDYAKEKMDTKKLDGIVLNILNSANQCIGSDDNEVIFIKNDGTQVFLKKNRKALLAGQLVDEFLFLL